MSEETGTKKPKTLFTKRIQHAGSPDSDGPVIVLFVGIHGNETAGVIAVDNVLEKISANIESVNGSLYAIRGNLEALSQGHRFIDTDLNRLWEMYNTEKDFSTSLASDEDMPVEYLESLKVKSAIENIIEKHNSDKQKIIFADLHTTSSESCAFILINDTLANRKLARKFPVPQILGIEENIQGTLLSYINNLGYRALGFEAGAHTSWNSISRSEAFIELLLHYSGVMKLNDDELEKLEKEIKTYEEVPDTYFEVRYHHLIADARNFNMLPGFTNFDPVDGGIPLAYENGKLVSAPESGRIFMPLYQKRGHDGFMIIKEVSPFWLTLSGWLRQSFNHSILKYLPGVTKIDEQSFEVDREIARLYVKEIFHLLGYRVTEKDSKTFICYRR